MGPILQGTLACAAAYLAAVLFLPALGLPRGPRLAALAPLGAGILLLPLLLPREPALARAFAAIFAGTMVMKMYDGHRGAGAMTPARRGWMVFLVNPFSHVHRRLDQAPVATAAEHRLRFARGTAAAAAGGLALVLIGACDLGSASFVLEHAAKVIASFVLAFGAGEILVTLWRLPGGRGMPLYRNFFLAPTPAEFWRRYNRPVTQFLHDDVFLPAGGSRAPLRATLAAFAVSGLLHEYIAAIGVGRVQGFQMAFFLVQGLAVAATWKVRPRGWLAAPWTALTVAFMLGSALLFAASAAQIFDVYSDHAPAWMHAR